MHVAVSDVKYRKSLAAATEIVRGNRQARRARVRLRGKPLTTAVNAAGRNTQEVRHRELPPPRFGGARSRANLGCRRLCRCLLLFRHTSFDWLSHALNDGRLVVF